MKHGFVWVVTGLLLVSLALNAWLYQTLRRTTAETQNAVTTLANGVVEGTNTVAGLDAEASVDELTGACEALHTAVRYGFLAGELPTTGVEESVRPRLNELSSRLSTVRCNGRTVEDKQALVNLGARLRSAGWPVAQIHGTKDWMQLRQAVERFLAGETS